VQIWDVTPNSSYISDLKNRERSDENSKILKILKDYNTKIGNRRSYSTFVSKKNLVNSKKKKKLKILFYTIK